MEKLITMPGGQFGYTGDQTDWVKAVPFVSAEAATTIARGNLVMWDTTTAGRILQHTTAGNVYRSVGIALEAIAPGQTGLVAVQGIVRDCLSSGAIAQFDTVIRSGATAGAVATDVPSVVTDIGNYVGIALTAAASNLVTLWVGKF